MSSSIGVGEERRQSSSWTGRDINLHRVFAVEWMRMKCACAPGLVFVALKTTLTAPNGAPKLVWPITLLSLSFMISWLSSLSKPRFFPSHLRAVIMFILFLRMPPLQRIREGGVRREPLCSRSLRVFGEATKLGDRKLTSLVRWGPETAFIGSPDDDAENAAATFYKESWLSGKLVPLKVSVFQHSARSKIYGNNIFLNPTTWRTQSNRVCAKSFAKKLQRVVSTS